MGVSLRVLSLGWLGVGSCKGFGDGERLCGYFCGYFMANGKIRGPSLRIWVAIPCRLAETCYKSTGEIILGLSYYR
jgi:hypothetical protein